MTRRRIPCTLSSRVIGSSSHSGFLGRTSTLGKIGQMALLFVHGKCQHYYESGHSSPAEPPAFVSGRYAERELERAAVRRQFREPSRILPSPPAQRSR